MSQEWEIRTASRVCAGTGEPFVDQQVIYSRLAFTAEGYVRSDFSEAAWTDEERGRSLSYWKSVYQAPKPPPPEALKKETAEGMLRQFMAKDDFSRKNAIYILAVMLERKRILKLKAQVREGGRRVLVYEHPRSGDVFTIADPDLQLDQLEEVQGQVSDLLAHGPDGAPPLDLVGDGPIEEPFNPPSEVASLAPADTVVA